MTKFFFIEGNISSGKSTFISLLENFFPKCKVIYEPLDVWKDLKDEDGKNILDHFYTDMKKYAYAFQSTAFLSRVIRLKEISDSTEDYVFIERSVYSDKNIFAKNCHESGIMSTIESKLYHQWFNWMENYFNIPQKYFIYLKCDPEISHKRIKERNRPEEESVSLEYLKTLHNLHEEWLNSRDDVLTLDASLPFRDDTKSLNILLNKIKSHINSLEQKEEANRIEIYTDGSCLKNPGDGGWGAVIKYNDEMKEVYGSYGNTTNNAMELTAGIKAIEELKNLEKFKDNEKLNVTMYTDSQYVNKGITQWIKNWKKNNWKTANKTAVKNKELWEKLDKLCSLHNVQWKWVKAHDGNFLNEKADELAKKGAGEC